MLARIVTVVTDRPLQNVHECEITMNALLQGDWYTYLLLKVVLVKFSLFKAEWLLACDWLAKLNIFLINAPGNLFRIYSSSCFVSLLVSNDNQFDFRVSWWGVIHLWSTKGYRKFDISFHFFLFKRLILKKKCITIFLIFFLRWWSVDHIFIIQFWAF